MPTEVKSEQLSFVLSSLPGVRRDGTDLDNNHYQDAIWTRFQRGRPRKMGGYRLLSDMIAGPSRWLQVDGRDPLNSAHTFSPTGIEKLSFDNAGVGGGVAPRTPVGFTRNEAYQWQAATLFQSGGAGAPNIIAAATPDALNLLSDVAGPVYAADITGTAAFTQVSTASGALLVSGGCCVLQPFLFVYGSNGLIKNCDANNFAPAGWTVGGSSFANEANVAGSKVVRGLATRGGGNAPAGMFWSLDSLIRVSFVNNGTSLWRYDTVSDAISVLAKNAIVEFDGIYYWPGVDRFFVYTGVVQELPNDMNLNFFYDNVNPTHRNKTFGMKVSRYGEIWWFFPKGDATEPNHAVIYNVREKTWYDTPLERSSGAGAQIFTLPLMAGGDARATSYLPITGTVGAFASEQSISGSLSGATGIVKRVFTAGLNVEVLSGSFINGDVVTTSSGSATVNATPYDEELNSVWVHETGVDRVYKQEVTAIESRFETTQFQWMSGGPVGDSPSGANVQMRLLRIEPDFVLSGSLLMYVNGAPFAQAEKTLSEAFIIDADTEFVDVSEQRRELSVIFVSNETGGDYQMGRNFITAEPGDVRG